MIDEDQSIEWNAENGGPKRFRSLLSARNPALAKKIAIFLQDGIRLEDLEIYTDGTAFDLRVRPRSISPSSSEIPKDPPPAPGIEIPQNFHDFLEAFVQEWGTIPPDSTATDTFAEIRRMVAHLAHEVRFPNRRKPGQSIDRQRLKRRLATARIAALLEKLNVELDRDRSSSSSSSSS